MVVAVATTQEEQVLQELGFDYAYEEVPLNKINGDSSAFNYRLTRLNEEVALQYGVAMENGAQFPPIVVHSESGITGLVIDSGVHRFHGRLFAEGFKTIGAFVLKNLNLKDAETVRKLDDLRIILNKEHGLGLDQTERKIIACNQIAGGVRTEAQAAKFFDLDSKALKEAYHTYELDLELRRYGLKPENFPRTSDKESVLRKGLTQDDMRDVERIVVRFSSEDVKRKVNGDQVRKLTRDLAEARTHVEKVKIMEAFRASMAVRRKPAGGTTSKRGQADNPRFRLGGVVGTVETLDVNALLASLSNSELAQDVYKDIKRVIDRLATVENEIAGQFQFPTITVLP